MSGKDHARFVGQDRRREPEFLDAAGDLRHLLAGMLPRVAGVGLDLIHRSVADLICI
jgi:hypothetical protein